MRDSWDRAKGLIQYCGGPLELIWKTFLGPMELIWKTLLGPLELIWKASLGPLELIWKAFLGPLELIWKTFLGFIWTYLVHRVHPSYKVNT